MKQFLTFLLLLCSLSISAQLVVKRNANLRSGPSTTTAVVEQLSIGDTLLLLEPGTTQSFYHIRSVAGSEGWVYRTLVTRLPASGNIDVNTAASIDNVEVRILDVGAGLCTLIKLPDNKFVIYDAGADVNDGDRTLRQIESYIPRGNTIELLVLSHTDADHIMAAAQVIKNYKVKKALWGGYERSMTSTLAPTGAYNRLIAALAASRDTENVNLNQRDSIIVPGNNFSVGNAKFTFLCGFGKPLPGWGLIDRGEKLNAVSIVMKLDYAGNSVLFCGDAVGRHKTDTSAKALIATEQFLVQRAAPYLKSTIVIAPHHGANNGSSTAFINLVRPEKVIFSSGHKYHHPTTRTAKRYLRYLTNSSIFRTDRGDDEGGEEWNYLRVNGTTDPYDDDTIQIILKKDQTYSVNYLIN
jgi:beta-lactamase superfamily II metal-dependent hydrolase